MLIALILSQINTVHTHFYIFVIKRSNFWDITTCSPLKDNRCFGGIYNLHLHGRRSKHETSVKAGHIQSSAYHLLSGWFLAWFILLSWKWRRHVPPKRGLIFKGLHGDISQKIELFVTTAVRTSNHTFNNIFPSKSRSWKIFFPLRSCD
jgi:hypothetical protein